jgi:general secretion pathway protein L
LNVLRIYFSAQWHDSTTLCAWALCDETGAIVQQGCSPLSDMPVTRDCIGILAADRVLTFTAPQPPGKKHRWQSALPFIAEEHSLTDPDDIHAVPSPSTEPGMITVSVTTKSWLKQILTATTAQGRPLRRLIAESFIPELPIDAWVLIWDGHTGFLRTSGTTGCALDNGTQDTPPLALTLCLTDDKVKKPARIELRLTDSVQPAAFPAWTLPVPLVQGKTWSWQSAPINDTMPNLLWGDYAPPLRVFDGLSKLRPALFILLAAFAIEVTATHIEWLMLAQEKQALTKNIEHVFHASFGDDSTLVDAPLQMQRNLANLRHAAGVTDDADFIPMLDTLTPSLGLLKPGTINSLNYESGKLELVLKLANASEVEATEQKLKRNGLKVRTSELHATGDGLQGKLTLTREGL